MTATGAADPEAAGDPVEGAGRAGGSGTAVVVLAEDLIWATRLVGQLRTLGAVTIRAGTLDAFEGALASGAAGRAVVDLTARSYDGVEATRRATAAGVRVLGVGQHDDHALRRAALGAGADRVLAYRKLFEDGHATLAAWLGVPAPVPGSRSLPAPTGRAEDPRE